TPLRRSTMYRTSAQFGALIPTSSSSCEADSNSDTTFSCPVSLNKNASNAKLSRTDFFKFAFLALMVLRAFFQQFVSHCFFALQHSADTADKLVRHGLDQDFPGPLDETYLRTSLYPVTLSQS